VNSIRSAAHFAGLAALFLSGAPSAPAADSDDAGAVVEGLYQALIETAAIRPAPDAAARFSALEPVVAGAFDLAAMGKLAAGRHWRSWTDTEREAFLDTFRRLSVTQHASNFASLTSDAFDIVASELTDDGELMQVDVVIRRRNGEEDVTLDYMLESDGERWRIVNVIRMGISSELSALRSEYHAILTDGDLNALLAELEAQIARCNAASCYER
jgi:phospholipid transport system substrate-binding protein